MSDKNNIPSIKDYADKKIFFSGIGGCSMNGLARILHSQGYDVSGSDRTQNAFTDMLTKVGIPVYIGQKAENVKGSDLLVYTPAVKPDNPERIYASENSIPQIQRKDLLGHITREFKRVIGIAGCHGKTTITSMMALILQHANVDATVHVGGDVAFLDAGTHVGTNNDIFVTEACEYVESFLELTPYIEVINNIDDDHLDYFKNLETICKAFEKYVALLPEDGIVFGCGDDPLVVDLIKKSEKQYETYGFGDTCSLTAKNITFDKFGNPSFDCYKDNTLLFNVSLNVPGKHNVMNSLAAISVSLHLGIDKDAIVSALSQYTLTKRRFEHYGEVNGVDFYHDYAHHPSEISACLAAAANCPHNKIWCVFQLNSYSRGKTLYDKYIKCFKDADFVLVPDIYPGREQDKGLIHATDLVKGISLEGTDCTYLPTFEDIRDYLWEKATPGDIVVGVGSGDIHIQLRTLINVD